MTEMDEDRRLVGRILTDNNQGASERLVNKYRESLLQFITERIRSAPEAEDLLQEVFARVFNGLRSFNPYYAFSTWLYAITDHCCIDYLRKTGKWTAGLARLDETAVSWEEIIGNTGFSGEDEEEPVRSDTVPDSMDEFMDLLPEKYRMVFGLRYIEKLKYRQISEATTLPIGTVKTYLFRAKAVLNAKAKNAD